MELNIEDFSKKISDYLGYDVVCLTDMTEFQEYKAVGISVVPKSCDKGDKTLAKDVLLRIDVDDNSFSLHVLNKDISDDIASYIDDNELMININGKENERLLYDRYTF